MRSLYNIRHLFWFNRVLFSCRFGDGDVGARFGQCRGWPWRNNVYRPQRGRSARWSPVDPLGRSGRLLLEATAPILEPNTIRTRQLRIQSFEARVQVANRHRSSKCKILTEIKSAIYLKSSYNKKKKNLIDCNKNILYSFIFIYLLYFDA